jgi:cytochrome c peroxidase
MRPRLALALALAASAVCHPATGELLPFSDAETRAILRHGPWPPPTRRDPSNRVSGDVQAIALGQQLFFDVRLSANGAVACATCHIPAQGWTDGRKQGRGLAALDRNVPTIVNAGLLRWFSWDGGADSLWGQALRALLHPHEMAASAQQIAGLVRSDAMLACGYRTAFRHEPLHQSEEQVLVDLAKAIAAFVETVVSGRTAFDAFRDALARDDYATAAVYPIAAQRGLRIFVGHGRCNACHVGPNFTNGEFHDVGVPFLVAPGRVDAGRYDGIRRLRTDRFNLLGAYSDDSTGAAATKTKHVDLQQANFGQFKTPSLRNVALTAPYMHDGRFATLHDVVKHYSELDIERLHVHGEALLRPLRLSAREIDDVAAFLHSLGGQPITAPHASSQLIECRR